MHLNVAQLFGLAFCCNTFVNQKEIPKGGEFADWSAEKATEGFDSVQYYNEGWECTVVWDPFALIATHKIHLDKTGLQRIASLMPNSQRVIHSPEIVKFVSRGTLKLTTFVNFELLISSKIFFNSLIWIFWIVINLFDYTGTASIAEVPDLKNSSSLGEFQPSWDSISLGRSHILSPQLQIQLLETLNFCSPATVG